MLTVQFVLFSLSLFYFSVIIATLRAVFNFEFHNQLRSLYSFPILIYFTHTSHIQIKECMWTLACWCLCSLVSE